MCKWFYFKIVTRSHCCLLTINISLLVFYGISTLVSYLMSNPVMLYIYIYIYIYCHPQTDCFVVSQFFSVARDRNPLNFTIDLVLSDLRQLGNYNALCISFCLFTFWGTGYRSSTLFLNLNLNFFIFYLCFLLFNSFFNFFNFPIYLLNTNCNSSFASLGQYRACKKSHLTRRRIYQQYSPPK